MSAVQYGARDKFLSGVVGGRTATESVAIVASADGESLQIFHRNSSYPLRVLLSGDVINKSLSGVKDKTVTGNTCLYMLRVGICSVHKQYL